MDLGKRRDIVLDGIIDSGDGDPLVFRFYPFRWTGETKAKMQKAADKAVGGHIFAACDGLADVIAYLVQSWNLTDGGKPVELTPDGLRALDYDMLFALIDHITARSMPARAERKAVKAAMKPPAFAVMGRAN